MKLLFDQNISPKITKLLQEYFPEAKQVRHVGLENASDLAIFDYARKNNFVIVTFDSDYVDLNLVRGIPPKIIWLKTGNLTTTAIAKILLGSTSVIQNFLTSPDIEILKITK